MNGMLARGGARPNGDNQTVRDGLGREELRRRCLVTKLYA